MYPLIFTELLAANIVMQIKVELFLFQIKTPVSLIYFILFTYILI